MAKRIKTLERAVARVVKHDLAYEAITFFLLLGILYFGVSGALMMVLRTETAFRPVILNCMCHDGEGWRARYEAMGYDTLKFPFQAGFEEGDMLIVRGVGSPDEISVGDVIIFDNNPRKPPYVHRVLGTPTEAEPYFVMKGDANVSTERAYFENIVGKAIFVIPNLGWLSPSLWWR